MKYQSMLLASAVLQAGVANGMGLGNIEVQSYLGAPLKAEANLISTRELGENEIQASIARIDIYDQFGARYEAEHSNLRFEVREKPSGELYLHITSPGRVVEPFLDIVVELTWPQGTTYRRYNLLIDPPEYAARWRKNTTVPKPVEQAAQVLVAQNKPKPALPKIELGGEYEVQSGDSLWKIAKRSRKGANLSIQQMMDVIYHNNPDAFIGGKKDMLMLGATLQVPDQNQLLVAEAERAQPVRLNQLDNQSYSNQPVAEEVPQPVVDNNVVENNPTLSYSDEVTTEQTEIELLKQQLAQLQKERAELVAFQQSVREEIADFKGKQNQLKQAVIATQQAIPEIVEANQDQPAPSSVLKTVEVEQESSKSVEPAMKSDLGQLAELANTEPMISSAGHDFIGDRKFTSDSLISKSGSSLWYLLGMVPLGLLIVFLGMRAHRVQEIRRSEEVKDEDLYDLVFGAKRDRSRSDSPEQLEKAMHQIREKADHFEEQHKPEIYDESLASKDDVSQMIELYMLYSQYQKALNVILTEISKRPARKDLRLYLMQVYAHIQDWDAFEDQMVVLERMGDKDLLKQAEAIRNSLKEQTPQRNAS